MYTTKPAPCKPLLSLPISFLFICQPLMAAEIVLDTRTHTAGHTMLDTAANGTPVVNIARPNTNGVSHNTYIEFNVPTQGTILNNAGQEVNTQLAGYIYGNENLRDGSASLILNEVSGTNRSRLNGYLEVAGPGADVIVANPNGITVNGGGFINIPKATLTTGKVSFSGDRPIFDIEGGDIFIDGKGLDARGTSSLELYTQALKLNAKLHANDVKVVTGLNHIDAEGSVTSRDSVEKERPLFSIDSTALGGIYANAISLVGTQKGVGVNLPAEMLVQDRLELSADGRIVLGKVSVQNHAEIRSKSNAIEVHEGVHAKTLEMQALTDITLKGNTGASSDLRLQGNRLTNEGIIAAGVHADFTQAQEGLLSLEFTESIHNVGVLYGLSGTSIDTKDFINADQAEVITRTLTMNAVGSLTNAGRIHANEVMELTAGNFDNTEGSVEGLESVTLDIADEFLNQSGLVVAGSALTLTTNTLDNTDGAIQAGETLTVSAAGDIANTRGTLYSGTGTTVTAQKLDNTEGFIGSLKAVFLDLFDLDGDNGTISGGGVTVRTGTMQGSHATILSSEGIDIGASGDVALSDATMLSNSGLNLTANGIHLNGSTLYAAYDSVTLGSAAMQLENVYMEADRLLNLYASETISVSDSTMRGNRVQAGAREEMSVTHTNIAALEDLAIETQTLHLKNVSLSAQYSGTIATGTLHNSDSMVSAAQMDIDTVAFNNADSYLYSAGGTLNIVTADTMDNSNGLISANGNLAVDTQHLNNRNGELEAGHTLAVSSGDLQIENSRFFAGNHLDVTSNIAAIDAGTKFLSANAMDLDFTGDLVHHGEILANGAGNIMVRGDLSNEGSITANGSLHIAADTLTNNANDTAASIRGGHLSAIMLTGDLNNHGFLTASGDLEITAASVHNHAAIAAAYGLTLHAANLYNYNTLFSGADMRLYMTDLLSNREDATIYAGANLLIASDDVGSKTGSVENISARIESGEDMVISAGEISNISATEITTTLQKVNGRIDITCDIWESFSCPALAIPLDTDLMAIKAEILQEYSDKGVTLSNSELQALLTERMVQEDREAYILNMYKDTRTTAGELYFYELTASLDSNAMIVKRTKPHKKEEFRKVDYRVTAEVVDPALLASHTEGEIVSGRNLLLDADTITNRTSLITAGNDIAINGNLFNIGVDSTESIDATINYSWKRKSDGGLGQLPVSKSEIRDTKGVPSQILAGGTLTGNFGVLQNGMEAGASVTMDPNAPTISTGTQTTEETQQTVTLPDPNAEPVNVDQGTIESTALALTPQVYDPAAGSITLPDNPYGVFVTSTDPDGPLIESNPEYTDYRNFVSSDYMLERLGYDGSSQTRRLGDAMYETQLVRDAVMAMTGERFIGMAESDTEQYT
ncbi:MAG TPA: filamentous hemagglutinin N-terminal domain-containing protein, partial [Sulfurovum sp.]|uniref:two-partner secretion domain-containing protein n=1 Tax=Sulfurovum sp. TaxID=1969726 RepID=UPI002F95CDEB